MPPYCKIDDHGRFCSFPGITVVSHVSSENCALWANALAQLSVHPAICSSFSLLPLSSLHVTIANLYTAAAVESAGAGSWGDFVQANLQFFRAVHEKLATHPLLSYFHHHCHDSSYELFAVYTFFSPNGLYPATHARAVCKRCLSSRPEHSNGCRSTAQSVLKLSCQSHSRC